MGLYNVDCNTLTEFQNLDLLNSELPTFWPMLVDICEQADIDTCITDVYMEMNVH